MAAHLQTISGPNIPDRISLEKSNVTIGCQSTNDVVLEGDGDGSISINRQNEEYVLEVCDLPVYLNGNPIQDKVSIKELDKIEIGNQYAFRFVIFHLDSS